jgi:hypothetical protein
MDLGVSKHLLSSFLSFFGFFEKYYYKAYFVNDVINVNNWYVYIYILFNKQKERGNKRRAKKVKISETRALQAE